MPAATSMFRRALAAGKPRMASRVGSVHACAAEIAGAVGFDWLLMDGEHVPDDLRAISERIGVLLTLPPKASAILSQEFSRPTGETPMKTSRTAFLEA